MLVELGLLLLLLYNFKWPNKLVIEEEEEWLGDTLSDAGVGFIGEVCWLLLFKLDTDVEMESNLFLTCLYDCLFK